MSQERNYNERGTAPRPRKRRRSAGRVIGFAMLYSVVIIIVSVILACLLWIAANDVLALNKPERSVTITVESTDTFDDVVDTLEEKGLIEYKFLFKLFAAVTNGSDNVSMGTYTLNNDMDYRALLANMSIKSATRAEVQVTIPEGYTVEQIFKLLEEKGVATVKDLNQEAAEHDYAFSFLQEIDLGDPERLEGYLYPDTYTFYTPHSPLYAINKLLVNFDARFTDEMRAEVAESGKTIREILTVASLIEKETDGTDHKKITSVIYNRLNSNGETAGFLQIDATLAYLNGGKVPTDADKQIDSPYNTYKYKGLPPAPICNPGMDSIQAAMHPDSTGYFYYALGDDGVHHFNKTYNDHLNFINSQQMYKK